MPEKSKSIIIVRYVTPPVTVRLIVFRRPESRRDVQREQREDNCNSQVVEHQRDSKRHYPPRDGFLLQLVVYRLFCSWNHIAFQKLTVLLLFILFQSGYFLCQRCITLYNCFLRGLRELVREYEPYNEARSQYNPGCDIVRYSVQNEQSLVLSLRIKL
ncbi:Hypothetical_protein [Hexamita inflata]|uniref:Hypothetical_protein n=1 Tax=Hexamita inflata TaxID=28002 RepID=A0AA86V043_9EUKA|nr:Hypothetical protein HINF_LOCUS62909 [Hexamita inflata]